MTSPPRTARDRVGRPLSLGKVLARAWRQLGSGSGRLAAVALVGSVLRSVAVVPVAFVLRHLIDRSVPRHQTGAVVGEALLLLLLVVGASAVNYVTRRSVLRLTQDALERLRLQVLHKLYALPRAYFDTVGDAELQSLVVQDTGRLEIVLSSTMSAVLPAVVVAVAVAVVAAFLQPLLFLLALVVQPLTAVVGRAVLRRVRGLTRRWQQAVDRYSGDVDHALRAMTLTRVTGTTELEVARQRATIRTVHDTALELANAQASARARLAVTSASGGVLLLGVGAVEVARGTLTAGTLLSFYAVAAVLARQVNVVLAALPQLGTAAESFGRIEALLDVAADLPYSGTTPHAPRGGLTLDRVSFGYAPDQPVLRDVSLDVRPGEHVALVGPNGSGKSTLALLVLGLYRPSAGALLLDGVAYDEVDLEDLHACCGVVLQDPVLLPGTIRDAIAHGRPGVSDEQVRAAAALVGLDEAVLAFPDGYATRVGDEGSRLSGGQRQRIALARALVGEPRLLVLDEPTNHLDDPATEQLLASLRGLRPAPTILTITHDQAVADAADRVLRLRDGRLEQARTVRRARRRA